MLIEQNIIFELRGLGPLVVNVLLQLVIYTTKQKFLRKLFELIIVCCQWRMQDFRKGGRENLRIMKTQKKGLHSDLACFSAQIQVKIKKKVFTQVQPVFLSRFSTQIPKGRGHDSILRVILWYL